MKLRPIYAVVALVVFAVEILIALFANDTFIRPYVGDVLAVALVYAILRATTTLALAPALILSLSTALVIEVAQVYDVLHMLGLGGSQLARILLGGAFDVLDLVAYAAGGLLILAGEAMFGRRNSP